MKDISVEYAHIYTNDKIDTEHAASLTILNDIKTSEDHAGKTLSLVVMVDDYSFPDPSFNYDEFIGWLNDNNLKPDITFRESQLIPVCDEVIKLIYDEKLKNQLTDYIKTKKYPCSLFIAAWYLVRLGCLSYQLFDGQFAAKQLLNILPESFKPFEEKAIEIIGSTPFADRVKDIQYEYFEGRLIA